MAKIIKAGEVWEITHTRKGQFTALFLSDFDPGKPDDFTSVEVVGGRARFVSVANQDRGHPGDHFPVRNRMVALIRKVRKASKVKA